MVIIHRLNLKPRIKYLGFIILTVLLSLLVIYFIGKKFFPFNKLFGHTIIPSGILLYSSPNNNGTSNSLLCNFESDTLKKVPSGFYKGISHSGYYSGKAFGKNSYSPAIEQTAGQIGIDKLKTMAMSAWIFVFPTVNQPDGIYILSVTNDFGVSKAWKGIYLRGSDIPKGKWFRMNGLFDLSGVILKPEYKVHIYFWNRSRTDILVDDYYVVLGAPKERRGESTLVDMTKNTGFTPRFNYPPFQTFFAGKEETGNRNSANILPDKSMKEGEILPDDKIVSGNFLQTTSGADAILIIPSSGKPELFGFCPELKSFNKINAIIPSEILSIFKSADVLNGRFSDKTYDQVGLNASSGFMIGSFSPLKNLCSAGKTVSSDFRVIWKPDPALQNPDVIPKDAFIFAGDLDADGYTELLVVTGDGSWKVLKFINGKIRKEGWSMIASGTGTNSPFGNLSKEPVQITIGRFLTNFPQDLVLTVKGDKSGKKFYSSLLRFDLAHSGFIPVDQNRFDGNLKIIGLDTLKPSDIFLFGDFRGKKEPGVLRYNRDWRFDLKELKFNDTTFSILGNIDFQGYEKDHNPKYYGILKIDAGRFIDPARTSLLLIGRNCKNWDKMSERCTEYENIPELPDFFGVYSLK